MNHILLNPGPVTLSQRVREALLRPDLCHREPEFADLQYTIRSQLLAIYDLDPARWAVILLTGSGTAAVEAMISTLVPPQGRLLILENGVYGERISKMARVYRIAHDRFTLPWGAAIELEAVDHYLETHTDVTHFAVIHHETTTGRLNDLESIGRVCKSRGIVLLVDGVSSFGAERLEFEPWGIGACAATANKCLHGVPGTSFVIVRRDLLPLSQQTPRTLYLDLASYCREQDQGGTPFTQSVQCFYALTEALAELGEEGGWRRRHERYRALLDVVWEGFEDLGVAPLLQRAAMSVVLNAFHLPQGVGYAALHDHLKNNGFVIYAGQGGLAQSIFRISTMGAIAVEDMRRLVAVMQPLLRV